jgi:RNA polymerase sigma-70 factor (ECF subfamily)
MPAEWRCARRGRSRGPTDSEADFPAADRSAALAQAKAVAFDAAFERLSVEQRALLLDHHLDGRGVEEIAARLGIPVGTAKSRLFTARKALESALKDGAQ